MEPFYAFIICLGLVQLAYSAHFEDFVQCGAADKACECDPEATVCRFDFYVETVFTFVKYNNSVPYSLGQGERYYIGEEGRITALRGNRKCAAGDFVKQVDSGLYCNEENVCVQRHQLCSDLLSVDSKTFKSVIAVNKQFPGPTLIVTEGQIVAVDVHNNLSTEGISIHWHGQHLFNTNFMDGVTQVTQCPILPGTSFRYIFKASPSGTFWYHTHIGSQRSEGLFGGLIVKEKEINYPVTFVDDPASHTLTIMDWYLRPVELLFRTLRLNIANYPTIPPYEVPSDLNGAQRSLSTSGPDSSTTGLDPYWAGLINGKGRHPTIPYERSSLSIFEVEKGQTYRFRLIHPGTTYGYMLSVYGHKLKVMATDGYLVEPVEVDYIAIEPGERYDFLLEANQNVGNYGIRGQTFEVDFGNSGDYPPYKFHEHIAEAILHYTSDSSTKPNSTQFEEILSHRQECTQENPCIMINCPVNFHPSYNISCFNIDQLRLVSPTPDSEMPDVEPDVTFFTNLAGYAGRNIPFSGINDNHFELPKFPLTTHHNENDHDKDYQDSFCDVRSVCPHTLEDGFCTCSTVMDIPYNATVRLVVSAIGQERDSNHAMHIHGHSVHILKMGFGTYSNETGRLTGSSRDLTCSEDGNDRETLDDIRCNNARFRSPDMTFELDRYNVRKDTFYVPSGGYVVVQFRANNPGYWLFHCHNEAHRREGMTLIIREAVDKINPPPEEMKTCGHFLYDIHEFMESLENANGGGTPTPTVFMTLFFTISGVMYLI